MGMSVSERRMSLAIAAVFGLRIFGFMAVLPLLPLAISDYAGANVALMGLAIGVYGLMQAGLQMPLGLLSDRIGRKPVVVAGLVMLLLGSWLAATAHSIGILIAGRALQGLGAVGSTMLAWLADVTTEAQRTKAMAIVGSTIGCMFLLAMVLGPALRPSLGLSGIFTLMMGLAVVAIIIIVCLPQVAKTTLPKDQRAVPALIKKAISQRELLRLDVGIMALHAAFTATFLYVPHVITALPWHKAVAQWHIYLPALVSALVLSAPLIMAVGKRLRFKGLLLGMVTALAISLGCLGVWHSNVWSIGAGLVLFFAAFTVLESMLPSLASKFAPSQCKGTAMGLFSSSKFLGIFLGGAVGGWLQHHSSMHEAALVFATGLLGVWLLVAAGMREPSAS